MTHGRTARRLVTAAAACALGAAAFAAPPTTAPDVDPKFPSATSDPRLTIPFLASDELAGRLPGSPGLVRAGELIAAEFDRIGLKKLPGHGDDFQPFPMLLSAKLDPATELTLDEKPLALGTDFAPLTSSAEGKFTGGVAFAGYGVTHADKAGHVDYDDYAGLDVKGKVVLLMRKEPLTATGTSRFAADATGDEPWSPAAHYETKAKAAAAHGAAAVLIVSPPTAGGPDRVQPFYGGGADALFPLPVVQVTRRVADLMLSAGGQPDLAAVQKSIDADFAPHSAVLDGVAAPAVAGSVVVKRSQADVRNVMGVLPGVGPRADEWVVVGAHYDHLGKGELGHMMSRRGGTIYHGADDNGSGTAAVLSLAEKVVAGGPRDRSVLFVCFTGEEEGLIGSEWFVAHPPIPLDHVAAMLNLDMVGRLRDDRLLVSGTGTAPALPELVKRATVGTDLDTRPYDAGGAGPSDQASFAEHKIPVLFLYTGTHRDYHTPTDTADKINYDGIDRVVAFSQKLVDALVAMPRQPYDGTHDAAGGRIWATESEPTPRPVFGVALADATAATTAPATAPAGAVVAEVGPGSAAEVAGVKPGDRIVTFDGRPVADEDELTTAIAEAKTGHPIVVKVDRDGKTILLHATLTAPKR